MRFSFLVIFSLLSYGIYAQDSIFSAKEAVNLALQQNLEIQIAQSDLEIASINNNWGNAGKWPLITASVNNTEALSNINQKLANGSSIERNNVSNNNFSTKKPAPTRAVPSLPRPGYPRNTHVTAATTHRPDPTPGDQT